MARSNQSRRAKPFSVRMTRSAVRYGVEDAGHPAAHAPASHGVQQWRRHTPAPSFESIAIPHSFARCTFCQAEWRSLSGHSCTNGPGGPLSVVDTRRNQIRRFAAERYRASVQLSHKPRTQVLEGRPSRCLGQGRPWASIPLWVSRAPSAGTSTVHIP